MAFATPNAGIGAKRLAVGAHFGVGSFLLQRLTALVLVAFVAILVVRLLTAGNLGYVGWASIFVPIWMKVLTLVAIFALLYHAWIGVKDIWMDCVKPVWVRLTLLGHDHRWTGYYGCLRAAAGWRAAHKVPPRRSMEGTWRTVRTG